MIIIYLGVFAGLIILLEVGLARYTLKNLSYNGYFKDSLVEPEQITVYESFVGNAGRLPATYIHVREVFPDGTVVRENDRFIKRNVSKATYVAIMHCFFLLPFKKRVSSIHLSFERRGVYRAGKYYLTAGDFLGFDTRYRETDLKRKIVVMPKRSEDLEAIRPLGGFLGNISVNRFLFEDPLLTIGYQEYTGREPMKSISWTQTARVGKPLVKKYDHTTEYNLAILLNMDTFDKESVERCFEITRTVCEELERKHIPYEFYCNGDVKGPLGELKYLGEGLGNNHFRTIMYGLGQSATQSLGTLDELVKRAVHRKKNSQNKNYILITPKLKEKEASSLTLLRKHSDQDICVLTPTEMTGGGRP